MPESTRDKAPEEVQGLKEQSDSGEAVATPDQSKKDIEDTAAPSSPHSPSHGKPWLVLLLIVILLPLVWFLLPQNTRQSWSDMLMNRAPTQEVSHPDVAPELEPAPRTVVPTPTASKHVAPKATPAPLQTPDSRMTSPKPIHPFNRRMTRPGATSEEVNALMTTIRDLRSDMETLQNQQAELRQELHVRQQLSLRTHLRWIANPQSQLPQIANFWQDIALLSILTETERSEAESMRKLAVDDADKLDAWSKRLQQLAATLPVPEHQDIIPKPKNPVFSWLTGRFHLRPAPTPEQQALSELRTKLLNTAHALSVQIWPQHKTWRHLLAGLREHFGDEVELSLPERLDPIQKDIATLRTRAADWLESI